MTADDERARTMGSGDEKGVPIVTQVGEWVTVGHAARMLGVQRQAVQQLVDNHRLEAVKVSDILSESESEATKKRRVGMILIRLGSIDAYKRTREGEKRRGPQPGSGGRPPRRKDEDSGTADTGN
jgi:hypothetical protein